MSRTALFATVLLTATGCSEHSCLEDGACAVATFVEGRPASFPDVGFADHGVELLAEPAPHMAGEFLVAEVRHPAGCAAPEVAVSILRVTAGLPAVAHGTMDLFAPEACDGTGDEVVSTVHVDLSEALGALGCVGQLNLAVPVATTEEGAVGGVVVELLDACSEVDQPVIVGPW
ncbi:MAG: hypothetical protein EP330_26345 [Deltaproteobacteria bacterium]|nr:MAG: hypothetical protein EP330_26345 [Deltaproteobacteria bacterium]